MRALVKKLIIETGRRILSPKVSSRVIVLCYHSVHPARPLASARPDTFEQHLVWLKESSVIVPFSKVWLEAARHEERDRPLVSITFDDGYADNHEYAFPLLHKHGVPATFFLTVGFIEHDPVTMERFRRFSRYQERPCALAWSQVREMRQAGMEFGTHTYSHPNLARLEQAEAEAEVRRSKAILEDRLGEGITLTAYPFGKPKRHFTAETMDIVAKVGYDCAAAIVYRSVYASLCRYAVPRFYVAGDSLSTLRDKIFGAWDLLGMWHERAPAFLQR